MGKFLARVFRNGEGEMTANGRNKVIIGGRRLPTDFAVPRLREDLLQKFADLGLSILLSSPSEALTAVPYSSLKIVFTCWQA